MILDFFETYLLSHPDSVSIFFVSQQNFTNANTLRTIEPSYVHCPVKPLLMTSNHRALGYPLFMASAQRGWYPPYYEVSDQPGSIPVT